MIALLLAADLTLQPPAPAPPVCDLPRATSTANPAPPRTRKLGDLPDASEVLLVDRKIGGCRYLQVVRTKVSQGGGAEPEGLHVQGMRGVLVPADSGKIEPATPTSDK
jgi:hypothetical protein